MSRSNSSSKNKIISQGYLANPLEGTFQPFEVQGSYYQTILKETDKFLADDGDWPFLVNMRTNETISVLEALDLAKKYFFFISSIP